MPKCSFSGESIPEGQGLMYVQKDGKILWFKNSKNMKNYVKLRRIPRNVPWTQAYRTEHKKGAGTAAPAAPIATTGQKKKAVVKGQTAGASERAASETSEGDEA